MKPTVPYPTPPFKQVGDFFSRCARPVLGGNWLVWRDAAKIARFTLFKRANVTRHLRHIPRDCCALFSAPSDRHTNTVVLRHLLLMPRDAQALAKKRANRQRPA